MPPAGNTENRIFEILDDVRDRLARVETLQGVAATQTTALVVAVEGIKNNGCHRAVEHEGLSDRLTAHEALPHEFKTGNTKLWVTVWTALGSALTGILTYLAKGGTLPPTEP